VTERSAGFGFRGLEAAGRSCLHAADRARAGAGARPRPLAAAAADPLLLATDAAEALVSEGVPFRDAHEQVAAAVRAGTFEPPRSAPHLGDVTAAVAAAKARWSAARDRQARS